MFSTKTMPMSTMVPMAMAMPPRAMMLASTPVAFIAPKVPSTPRGSSPATSAEPRRLRSITSTTRTVISSCWTRA
jgi:hypothetical protein